METRERKKSPKMNVGSVSIVVIFVVLCLTVFAVLSFTTANSQLKLAEKGAAAIEDYYAADFACAMAASEWQSLYSAEGGGAEAVAAAAEAQGAEVYYEGELLYVHYSRAVDAAQELRILLAFGPSDSVDITDWKVVATDSWEPEDSMVVWDGE